MENNAGIVKDASNNLKNTVDVFQELKRFVSFDKKTFFCHLAEGGFCFFALFFVEFVAIKGNIS